MGSEDIYYYWVRAVKDVGDGHELLSEFSAYDKGSPLSLLKGDATLDVEADAYVVSSSPTLVFSPSSTVRSKSKIFRGLIEDRVLVFGLISRG